jgi:hypothetical protein
LRGLVGGQEAVAVVLLIVSGVAEQGFQLALFLLKQTLWLARGVGKVLLQLEPGERWVVVAVKTIV